LRVGISTEVIVALGRPQLDTSQDCWRCEYEIQFRSAKKRVNVSIGESVRIIRELQGFSQNKLASLTGLPQATLSAIRNDRVRLGLERSKVSAGAKKMSPSHSGIS
jgi:DNA-binding XRE family transcriptional regulator